MSFKISYNKEDCIGCSACVAVCSDNWEINDGKAIPKKETIDEIGCNQDAADSCPMNCISIQEE